MRSRIIEQGQTRVETAASRKTKKGQVFVLCHWSPCVDRVRLRLFVENLPHYLFSGLDSCRNVVFAGIDLQLSVLCLGDGCDD